MYWIFQSLSLSLLSLSFQVLLLVRENGRKRETGATWRMGLKRAMGAELLCSILGNEHGGSG